MCVCVCVCVCEYMSAHIEGRGLLRSKTLLHSQVQYALACTITEGDPYAVLIGHAPPFFMRKTTYMRMNPTSSAELEPQSIFWRCVFSR